MPRRREIYNDGRRCWDITQLLRRYPQLLSGKNHTLRLADVAAQQKKVWLLPSKRLPDLAIPVLMLRDGTVIDGWHRIHLALSKKRKTLPAYILTDEQERAARLATLS